MFADLTNSNFGYDTFYAAKVSQHEQIVKDLEKYDVYFVIFPLYTDAMPGLLKALFEKIEETSSNVKHYII